MGDNKFKAYIKHRGNLTQDASINGYATIKGLGWGPDNGDRLAQERAEIVYDLSRYFKRLMNDSGVPSYRDD